MIRGGTLVSGSGTQRADLASATAALVERARDLLGGGDLPEPLQIVDDGAAGFATVGAWTSVAGGYLGECAVDGNAFGCTDKLIGAYDFVGTLFLNALKMLIVPLIVSSIIVGVAGIGSGGNLGALGGKTLLYYATTSLLAIVVGLLVGIGAMFVGGFVLAPFRPDSAKNSPFECGFEAFEDARMNFDVRYYLVAILFIIFDLEIAFLFPWAVSLDAVGKFGLLAMALFLAILVVGFIYEWKKGALEWD